MTITLAPVCLEDGPDLIRANLDSVDFHLPWTQPFTDKKGFTAWYLRCQAETHVGLVLRERASGNVAGVVNVSEIVRGAFQSAYLGYYAMRAAAGRGLMTAGLRAAVNYAFTTLDLHRVEANVRPENLPSLALIQRVGFRKEGYSARYLFLDGAWRDHERWAICRED